MLSDVGEQGAVTEEGTMEPGAVASLNGSRPHVLLAIRSLATGGMERRCLRLANGLVAEGCQVTLMLLTSCSKPTVGQPDPRVNVVRIGLRSLYTPDPRGWYRFVATLRRHRPMVYHDFGGQPGGGPRMIAARLAGVPVVVNGLIISHAWYQYGWWVPAAQVCFQFADYALANSKGVADFHVQQLRFPPPKVVTIPNPVDTTAWPSRDPALRRAVRAELGLREDQVALGIVARMVPQKRHVDLLHAFAMIAARHPEAVLLLAGDGPRLDEMVALAEQLGISGQCRFLGRRDDVPRVLQALDLFCLSSQREGMSNAVLEAMATSLPVVMTRVSGVDELVVPGQTGWVVPIGEPPAYAQALEEALSDRDRLDRFGQAGRRRVVALYDKERIIRTYLDFYTRITRPLLAKR